MATRTLDVIAATLVPSTNSGFLGLCTTPAHYLIMAQEESGEQTRVRVKVNDCKVCRSDNPNLKPTITVKTEIDGFDWDAYEEDFSEYKEVVVGAELNIPSGYSL